MQFTFLLGFIALALLFPSNEAAPLIRTIKKTAEDHKYATGAIAGLVTYRLSSSAMQHKKIKDTRAQGKVVVKDDRGLTVIRSVDSLLADLRRDNGEDMDPAIKRYLFNQLDFRNSKKDDGTVEMKMVGKSKESIHSATARVLCEFSCYI
jgi:hypothetical protein